jgi:hypothetical protein
MMRLMLGIPKFGALRGRPDVPFQESENHA